MQVPTYRSESRGRSTAGSVVMVTGAGNAARRNWVSTRSAKAVNLTAADF